MGQAQNPYFIIKCAYALARKFVLKIFADR